MNTEPVLTVTAIAAAIVALAGIFNLVLDLDAVTAVAVVVVPLIGALIARAKVTPV